MVQAVSTFLAAQNVYYRETAFKRKVIEALKWSIFSSSLIQTEILYLTVEGRAHFKTDGPSS